MKKINIYNYMYFISSNLIPLLCTHMSSYNQYCVYPRCQEKCGFSRKKTESFAVVDISNLKDLCLHTLVPQSTQNHPSILPKLTQSHNILNADPSSVSSSCNFQLLHISPTKLCKVTVYLIHYSHINIYDKQRNV